MGKRVWVREERGTGQHCEQLVRITQLPNLGGKRVDVEWLRAVERHTSTCNILMEREVYRTYSEIVCESGNALTLTSNGGASNFYILGLLFAQYRRWIV